MSKGMKIFLGIVIVLVILGIMAYSSIKGTYNSLVVLDENINFLHKPYSVQVLAKKVREILDEN